MATAATTAAHAPAFLRNARLSDVPVEVPEVAPCVSPEKKKPMTSAYTSADPSAVTWNPTMPPVTFAPKYPPPKSGTSAAIATSHSATPKPSANTHTRISVLAYAVA